MTDPRAGAPGLSRRGALARLGTAGLGLALATATVPAAAPAATSTDDPG